MIQQNAAELSHANLVRGTGESTAAANGERERERGKSDFFVWVRKGKGGWQQRELFV